MKFYFKNTFSDVKYEKYIYVDSMTKILIRCHDLKSRFTIFKNI